MVTLVTSTSIKSISTMTHHTLTTCLMEIKSWNFLQLSYDKSVLIINDPSPKPPTNSGSLSLFTTKILIQIFITSRQDYCSSFFLQQASLTNSKTNSSMKLLCPPAHSHPHHPRPPETPLAQCQTMHLLQNPPPFTSQTCHAKHWTCWIFISLNALLICVPD